MDYLFSTHRLNRCKKVQVNFPDVSKSLGETIQVQFLDFDKLSRKFPLSVPRLGLADAEIRIVTKSEITKLRRKGYVVEVLQKKSIQVLSPCLSSHSCHSRMACCQSVCCPCSMACRCCSASSRARSRARLAFMSAIVASSSICMAPRFMATCSSSSPKEWPGSLKSEMLNS